MRKLFYSAMCVATAATLATPALAQPPGHRVQHPGYRAYAYAPPVDEHNGARIAAPVAGVATGTVIGVGIAEGWGTAAITAAAPATAVGAAAVGGVAGIGALAATDFVLEPCRGLHAMFGLNREQCVDGHYVGNRPLRPLARR